jgi:hypothetical protein
MGSPGPLASYDAAYDTRFDAVTKQGQVSGRNDLHGTQLRPAVCHWVPTDRDASRRVVGNHPLMRLHSAEGRLSFFITVQLIQKRPCMSASPFHLPKSFPTMYSFSNRIQGTYFSERRKVCSG